MYNYIRMKLCRHVTTSVCVRVHIMYVCMYVFIYVCMYDCTCVCTLLCVRIYACICMCLCILCIYMCVCVCLQGRHFLWDGRRCTPTFGSRGGYKGVHRFRGTRGYMKISMCYELSLHVDNDLR